MIGTSSGHFQVAKTERRQLERVRFRMSGSLSATGTSLPASGQTDTCSGGPAACNLLKEQVLERFRAGKETALQIP
jgi:hypothetical protein